MNELIRTLAAFGRPFPPELREIYLRLEKDPKHPRGPSGVATGSAGPLGRGAELTDRRGELRLPGLLGGSFHRLGQAGDAPSADAARGAC